MIIFSDFDWENVISKGFVIKLRFGLSFLLWKKVGLDGFILVC